MWPLPSVRLLFGIYILWLHYSGYTDVPVQARPCQKDCVIPVALVGCVIHLLFTLPNTECFKVKLRHRRNVYVSASPVDLLFQPRHTDCSLEVNWLERKFKTWSSISTDAECIFSPCFLVPLLTYFYGKVLTQGLMVELQLNQIHQRLCHVLDHLCWGEKSKKTSQELWMMSRPLSVCQSTI